MNILIQNRCVTPKRHGMREENATLTDSDRRTEKLLSETDAPDLH